MRRRRFAALAVGGFIIAAASVRAQTATNDPYPSALPMDSCGGAPGDPPLPSFAAGKADPNFGPSGRLRRWSEQARLRGGPVLLTGIADPHETGFSIDLAGRRAEAVRQALIESGIDANLIWTRSKTVTGAAEAFDAMGGVVTIEEPERAASCIAELQRTRIRWFLRNCGKQAVSDAGSCQRALLDLEADQER